MRPRRLDAVVAADAEEWRDLIAQYQQAASAAVARFGGHVAKNLGDGLLIFFGWSTAREDDPERAVRAGLAIVDAMAPLNATIAPDDGTRLAVRIGLHTGPVVIADGGEVFGETANVAARVQGAAEPDTVVITAATQRLVAGMFVVEDRGPQMLTPLAGARGWSHPECEQTYARARELASQVGESPEVSRALTGMAYAYLVKGDLATAAEVAQEALAAAERTGDAKALLAELG